MGGVIKAVYQHETHYSRPLCLVLPVDELQVDLGSWAEQAVGFGLDISSQRRHANVELLNDLPTETKRQECQIAYLSHHFSLSLSASFVAQLGKYPRRLLETTVIDCVRHMWKGDVESEAHPPPYTLHTLVIQDLNFPLNGSTKTGIFV